MQQNEAKTSDLLLWQQFQAGNASALESLMTLYFRILFNYGTKFCANPETIKDFIQELFLHLWENRHKLNAEVHVKAYLLASLRRRIHRGLKSKSNQPFANSLTLELTLDFVLEVSVEDMYIQDEGARALALEVKNQLQNLPQRQREVVYLKFFEGLSREQIGEIMGINDQSISNLLQLALKRLKANWRHAAISLLTVSLQQV